jgi:hypothetical protein
MADANGASEGGLALDELLDTPDSPATKAKWRKVWKMVRQEFMPPVDAEPLRDDFGCRNEVELTHDLVGDPIGFCRISRAGTWQPAKMKSPVSTVLTP